MEVICLEDAALSKLIDELANRINIENKITTWPWLSAEEAMDLLKTKSKTTLRNLRDEQRIKFTQPFKKTILYEYESILKYLEEKSIKPL